MTKNSTPTIHEWALDRPYWMPPDSNVVFLDGRIVALLCPVIVGQHTSNPKARLAVYYVQPDSSNCVSTTVANREGALELLTKVLREENGK